MTHFAHFPRPGENDPYICITPENTAMPTVNLVGPRLEDTIKSQPHHLLTYLVQRLSWQNSPLSGVHFSLPERI